MGSTSETYENGTNVVVYVANENAHIRSQQQQHHYHSHGIVSAHLRTTNDNEDVYNVCPEYGPSALKVTNYETETVVAEENSTSFDISHQNDSDSCAINGDSMCDDTSFASYNGDESDKLLINNNSSCFAGNGPNVEPVPVLAPVVPFVSEKLSESTAATANFAAISETSYARSESARSVDSVTSACSSLSSSSAGGNSKVVPLSENFAANVSANTDANCATGGGNFNSNQGNVTFPSYRVVPASNKESDSASFQKPNVSVPYGWKRLLSNGSIIYISPSNSVLTSLEQVNSYLLTDGNCFCGLDCPLYSHTVFNFDPEVITSPTVPATSSGFAKLCNHKRKRIAQINVPSTGLPNQSYETVPVQSESIASRPLIANYCNPGAVVKKHVFDISDRRKKRKVVPGQIYVNDDAPVPSPIMNDCDISAKENNPVMTVDSQVDTPACNQQLGLPMGMPERLTSTVGSTIRLKSPFNQSYPNQQTYYNNSNNQNQNYNFNVQQSNDCFAVNSNHNRSNLNQTNVFVEQDEFRTNQNNVSYICSNPIKNNVPLQPCSANASMNQHHHCGNMMPQNHPMNPSQQSPQVHLPIGAQQQSQQKQTQQFQPQHQHQMINQQNNFQPMRVIPNHQHHHHMHHHQHGNNNPVMHNSINSMDINKQNDFMGQPEKSDKAMYEHACELNANTQCRPLKSGNSFCNCYHVEGNHLHQTSPQLLQPSQPQNSCMSDCSGNCSSVIVQNAQGQQIIMQPNHHIHDNGPMMQPQMMHHQPIQQHHPHMHNQMQSPAGQVYPHHVHHHQSQNQQPTQAQQMYIMQQQQQQQQQHHQQQQHQHQQMQMMQTQNQDDLKAGPNRCGQMMQVQVNNNQNNHNHVNNIMAQRQSVMWQQKGVQHAAVNTNHNVTQCMETSPSASVSPPNPFERVPPLHSHVPPSPTVWTEDTNRKKVMKNVNKSPITTVGAKKMKLSYYQDGRIMNQTSSNTTTVSSSNANAVTMKDKNDFSNNPVPSFMDDPSGYLAQQTALLNSTISKQTGENPSPKCYSQSKATSLSNSQLMKSDSCRTNSYKVDESKNRLPQAKTPDSSVQIDSQYTQYSQRKNSASNATYSYKMPNRQQHIPEDNPVTSSTYDRERNASLSPSDSRSPIQAGTVSTSNQSPVQAGMTSPNHNCGSSNGNSDMLPQSPAVVRGMRENDSPVATIDSPRSSGQCAVTTVVSGHTCSSNTITSVLAGRTNTAVVSMNNTAQNSPPSSVSTAGSTRSNSSGNEDNGLPGSSSTAILSLPNLPHPESQIATKSPLEMVQSVVSSIQIPTQNIEPKRSIPQNSLQASHFLVSNNGQLLVATSTNPTQTVVSQQNITKVNSPVSMISNSSVVTNVTGTVTQVIPTVGVAQQVLGQPTVLVNTLPSGQLVFQPSVMAVHSAGNTVQIPQLAVATNNVVSGQTLADAGTISVATSGSFSPRGQAQLLSPETAKRKINNNKKRKLSPQQVLQITQSGGHNSVVTSAAGGGAANAPASNGASMMMQSQAQQNFTQGTPMLQTLILPSKNNQFASTQPLIATANVLQPVNLVHNIPTIQQFIVPAGLGGMVMTNADGTATILPDTVQLNVLTPMQNTAGTMFSHAAGQGILTASPTAGMVIRTQPSGTPTAAVNQLRSQSISTPSGTQFIATTPTLIVATNNTFSQTSSSYSGSPPDTTTHSPIGNSGQSPDTPSSSIVVGSTDDIASPTSSTSIGSDLQRQPMVYCISSSNVVDWTDTAMEEKKVNIIVEEKKVQCSLIFKEFPKKQNQFDEYVYNSRIIEPR